MTTHELARRTDRFGGVVLPYHSLHAGWTYVIHLAANLLVTRFGIPHGVSQGRPLLRRSLKLHPRDFAALLAENRIADRYDFADVFTSAGYVRVTRWQ